jgi:hypothetical protein
VRVRWGSRKGDIPKQIDESAKVRREDVLVLMADAQTRRPRPTQEASVMAGAKLATSPPVTCRMESGSDDRPKEQLEPHYPVVLRTESTQNPPAIVPPTSRSSGRRTTLAKWLASPSHPLTHRVWVNRLWQGHFGQGLVVNANDFGTQTAAPTHPELFDWLTSEFISHGFSSKFLHRQIVISATYRQASQKTEPEQATGDNASTATNIAAPYSFYPRQRLSSERIRDAWLMASGQLNDQMYGPGVRAELPPNFSAYEWKVSEPNQQVRRSVYLFAKRNLPYPMMAAFDFPDMHEACGCRTKTTIAPQALMLLNNRIILKAAQQLATRAGSEAGSADPGALIQRAWTIALGRSATSHELQSALKFVADQQRVISESKTDASPDMTSASNPADEAMADLCHALLNANEFLFVE